MSTCISRAGEYGNHATSEGEFICDRCGVLDEDGIFAERDRLRSEVERLRVERDAAQEHVAYHLRDFSLNGELTGDLAVDMAAYSGRLRIRAEAAERALADERAPSDMVREMHEHLGAYVNYGPPRADIPDDLRDIRIALLDEEVSEYRDAALAGDLVGVADGLADLIYVAYGTAHTYGIPIDAVLAEVHRSNMTKRPNPDGGKFIKGTDFSPADVRAVLADAF